MLMPLNLWGLMFHTTVAQGIQYKELHQLLKESQVVFACLNKNVILLNDEEFKRLGNKKILFNTSIGPASDSKALKNWLDCKDNYYCCDTEGAIGDNAKELINYPNVLCAKKSAGMTKQAYGLLTKKVLDNIIYQIIYKAKRQDKV